MSNVTKETSELTQTLRSLLLSGAYAPGAPLVERELAQRLHVSRIPLREALSRLQGLGLLIRQPGRGSLCLRDYTAETAAELYEYREAIERQAIRLACRRSPETELLRLSALADRLMAIPNSYRSTEWAASDLAFHHQLVRLSGNERLIHAFEHLMDETSYLFYHYAARHLRPRQPAAWIREHTKKKALAHHKLAAALGAKNETMALALLSEQLTEASHEIQNLLLHREVDPSTN